VIPDEQKIAARYAGVLQTIGSSSQDSSVRSEDMTGEVPCEHGLSHLDAAADGRSGYRSVSERSLEADQEHAGSLGDLFDFDLPLSSLTACSAHAIDATDFDGEILEPYSSRGRTAWPSHSWLTLEAEREVFSSSQCMNACEDADVTTGADNTRHCSTSKSGFGKQSSQGQLSKRDMEEMSRMHYVRHVHGAKLAEEIKQIRRASRFGRFAFRTIWSACVQLQNHNTGTS
jgi:hypothetical protein